MLQIKLIEVAEHRMRKVNAYGVTLKVPFDTQFLAMDKGGDIYAYTGDCYACDELEQWALVDWVNKDHYKVLDASTDYTFITPCDWWDTKVAV